MGPVGYIFFTDVEPVDYRTAAITDAEKAWEFWFNMLNRDVIPWSPSLLDEWYVSVAHTKGDIAKTIETSGEALRTVKRIFGA